jgi:hypothetical protein
LSGKGTKISFIHSFIIHYERKICPKGFFSKAELQQHSQGVHEKLKVPRPQKGWKTVL